MEEGYIDLPYRRYFENHFIGERARNNFSREDTRYPRILLLPQPLVEAALLTKLSELGGSVEYATELADFNQVENGVACRLENPNWTEDLQCRYMIACDGGKGSTRKKAGIQFVGETHPEEQLWVGDVEVEGLEPDAWYNWFGKKYGISCALFPFKNSTTWQIQAGIGPDKDGNIPTPTLEGFNELFKERVGMEGVHFTASSWQSIFRVNIRRADRFRVGNLFVAGDAAHVHSIAGGMGMNTGIQDAYNLAWKLAAVYHNEAGDRLLDTYGEERIPIADWTLKTTSNQQAALLNAAVSGSGGFEHLSTTDTTQLNLAYGESSLSAHGELSDNGLQAGDRAPDVQMGNDQWLSDSMNGTQWILLTFGESSGEMPVEKTFNKLKVVQAHDPAVNKAYGLSQGIVLIRPDKYIALISKEYVELNNYFDKVKINLD
jgi:2-polyprenyl-6-methoxyphenol hydroxylase-like FAD-dependent oxidoreductase